MQSFFIVIAMIIIGAIIGGVTNMIAVKMLFHPFKAYYIFGKRIPFTPGLIPKRRHEIASKIGQVVEDHLLTESLIREKITSTQMQDTIKQTIRQQVEVLKQDDYTLQSIASNFDVDLAEKGNLWIDSFVDKQLTAQYKKHYNEAIDQLIPNTIVEKIDTTMEDMHLTLLSRVKAYLTSEKGYSDIYEMLESFFLEKGKIVGMLQMFMTKEAIAERIQVELLRLIEQPKAQRILKNQILKEYERFKSLPLNELINETQFESIKHQVNDLIIEKIDLNQRVHQPLHQSVPFVFNMLDERGIEKASHFIIDLLANRLSQILKKVNLRGLVEEQINRFDLDYIENLIFEIANKELKLIMLLGFILGGVIGLFQGLIAIFV